MESKHLIIHYLIKRTFLFFDEWLFSLVLYKLFTTRYYKSLLLVLLYGAGCLHTSYTNISIIEKRIIQVEQKFFVTFKDFRKIYTWIISYFRHTQSFVYTFDRQIKQ